MTEREFREGWAVLTAALGFTAGKAQKALYWERLRGLEGGAFVCGVGELVESEVFADMVRFRRFPTLHEFREACRTAAERPQGRPYVAGVPLTALLAEVGNGGQEPTREEAPALVEQVATRARRVLPANVLPGPGNSGHQALLRREPVRVWKAPNADDWDCRRRKLLEQGDELLGAGEFVREESNG